jgi:BMFP domain-containing protein YqiC
MDDFLQTTIELNRAQRELAKVLQELDLNYSAEAEEVALDAEDALYDAEEAYNNAMDAVQRAEHDAFVSEHMNWGRI